MIIIADAHVGPEAGNVQDFFAMLGALDNCAHDIIFLGDIFDLWIALPGYEAPMHSRFIQWCRRQKKRRTIGFVEGNHEFFVAEERSTSFSWCSAGPCRLDSSGYLFCHGDHINRRDRNYLRFRRLSKNKLAKGVLRSLPWGNAVTEHLKRLLKHTNNDFRCRLPTADITAFADRRFQRHGPALKAIFAGHFHCQMNHGKHGHQQLYIVPDWLSTGLVGRFDPERRELRNIHWRYLTG